VAGARTRFDEFADRESGAPRPSRVDGGAEFARVPRRSVAAPLDSQRHRVAGAERESRANRERLRALERRTPDAALRFDLAWQACDGRRDLGAIADLVALETGRETRAEIAEFFEWAEGRGLLLEWC
jgi:hypothetical protein